MTAFDAAWKKMLDDVRTGTPRAAQRARGHAALKVKQFLNESVYDTTPGNKYERTGEAARRLAVHLGDTSPGDYTLTVESAAPYAAQIEQGNQLDYVAQVSAGLQVDAFTFGEAALFAPQISLDELAVFFDEYAQAVGSDFSAGHFWQRSGQDYQEPGPHVVPAAIAGAYRFAEELERVWTEAAQRSS